ncbi:MAG TPA: metallophosphoesterase family protein, partial [Rhodothermales bacterium]|nr:metallophosphoesterase family protein [Rhodothermales bacterium]
MSFIAVGDIHGCAQTLDVLLKHLSPGADDHLVFVGDYVDRGPDSKGVIDRLLALREEVHCTFLRGNHEALMLSYLSGGDANLWWANGGVATLRSYGSNGTSQEIPASHVEFIRGTQLYLDTPDFFFVHAGLKPNLTIAKNLARYG